MVDLPVSRDRIGWPTKALPVSRATWTVKCGRSAAVRGPPGTPLVAGGHQAAVLVDDADRGEGGGVDGAIGDEAGDVDGGAARGVLALDVAGDGVGAVDGADGELLEGDREVRVAIDRGGDRLAPLEPRLGDHRDPHQADGRPDRRPR